MKRENWLYELKITPNDKLETLYTVKFTGVNGIKNQYVKSGALLTDPGDQVKEGYTFEGWYNGSKKWNFAKDTVTSDMTLEAKFTRDVSVTYTLNNATSSNTVSTTKENESFATTITASANYVIDSIQLVSLNRWTAFILMLYIMAIQIMILELCKDCLWKLIGTKRYSKQNPVLCYVILLCTF